MTREEVKPYIDNLITGILSPAKWLYSVGVWFHNWLYDSNIKKQYSFDVPVITVGNITVGGTGKTPHVEYLIEALSEKYNIAVLSRGYKRKTKGFILASAVSTPEQIGDEPYQIFKKYGSKIKLAVSADRKRAVERIMRLFPETNLIILDDGYQYRKIKPLLSILLLDSNRPIDKDTLLPIGRLREPQHATDRADMIVITKCPEVMSPIEYRTMSKSINLLNFQKLFFSSVSYKNLRPVFEENSPFYFGLDTLTENDSVILVTGIAHPRGLVKHFKKYPCKLKVMRFPDHHDFTRKDINAIKHAYININGKRKIIVTTEKDAVRMLHNPYFPYKLKPHVYYLPIKVTMHNGFDSDILEDEIEKAIQKRHISQ